MSENEKKTCSSCGEDRASSEYLVCAVCTDEHDAVVAKRARGAALEEVAALLREQRDMQTVPQQGETTRDPWDVLDGAADDVVALKSQPARRYLDAGVVRAALMYRVRYAKQEGHTYVAAELQAVAEALDLDLAAGPRS